MANLQSLCLAFFISVVAFNSHLIQGNFADSMYFDWGARRSSSLGTGDNATLILDQSSGSGIQSKSSFLFGSMEMHIKLVPGNSAGTVTAYYLSSIGDKHDEIDFEFLGNISGQPYIIHTNIYTQGAAGREQQFYPWFDPTADYHNYTIHWNPSQVVWYVDSIPIRVYRNYKTEGIPYPVEQAMRVYSSIWNADSWATRAGLVKIDWTKAPFIARLRRFRERACEYDGPLSVIGCASRWSSPLHTRLSFAQRDKMNRVRNNYMIYNYCEDFQRFNGLFPGECFMPHF